MEYSDDAAALSELTPILNVYDNSFTHELGPVF